MICRIEPAHSSLIYSRISFVCCFLSLFILSCPFLIILAWYCTVLLEGVLHEYYSCSIHASTCSFSRVFVSYFPVEITVHFFFFKEEEGVSPLVRTDWLTGVICYYLKYRTAQYTVIKSILMSHIDRIFSVRDGNARERVGTNYCSTSSNNRYTVS